MKEFTLSIIWLIICFVFGGFGGMVFDQGFHPWCWYGLLFGIVVLIGCVCCFGDIFD